MRRPLPTSSAAAAWPTRPSAVWWASTAFGHPNLYVADGSVVPANLGVNPSLTITALAEYIMSQVPAKDG